MLDRVREALFSILGVTVEDTTVLDLFAGTGSLGLEALSRGAAHARFVEKNPRSAKLCSANVNTLGLGEQAEVVVADALSPESWCAADLVFFDPPYPLLRGEGRSELFRALTELVGRGAQVVFHAPRREVRPVEVESFQAEVREYGKSALWFLESAEGA